MWLLVVNSKAGKGRASKLAGKFEVLLKSNNLPYEIINKATYEETFSEYRLSIASGKFEKVVAIGGDGLVVAGGSWFVGTQDVIDKLIKYMVSKDYDIESFSFKKKHLGHHYIMITCRNTYKSTYILEP